LGNCSYKSSAVPICFKSFGRLAAPGGLHDIEGVSKAEHEVPQGIITSFVQVIQVGALAELPELVLE
jgi:hypothetical protein